MASNQSLRGDIVAQIYRTSRIPANH